MAINLHQTYSLNSFDATYRGKRNRSGPGNLNSVISGNFGYNAGPESVW
jgi:hypothetical protein